MRAFWVDSTPDTGCTITLLNLDVALRNGIHIDWTKTVELYHAASGSMHVEEMANIRVYAQKVQATLQVAVSSKLKETYANCTSSWRTSPTQSCRSEQMNS